MPLPLIPLLLGGAALLTAGVGVKKGFDAKEDFDRASSINSEAESIYNAACTALEEVHTQVQKSMEELGTTKFKIFKKQLIPFVDAYSTIQNIRMRENTQLNTLNNENSEQNKLSSLQSSTLEMQKIVGGGITALGTGGLAGLAAYGSVGFLGTASTGTAIGGLTGVAATNATLAWLGGGSLAAGGLGMAGGMVVLGGIVAAPVLAVGGFMMANKAEEAKENAYANLSIAKGEAERINLASVKTNAVGQRFEEINTVLQKLSASFTPLLEGVQRIVKVEQDYEKMTQGDQEWLHVALNVAFVMKKILDVPLLTADGEPTDESAPQVIQQSFVLE